MSIFSSPRYDPPPIQQAPPAPTRAEASSTAANEASKIRRGQGRQSTILTSGLGDTGTPTVGKKTLLGQ